MTCGMWESRFGPFAPCKFLRGLGGTNPEVEIPADKAPALLAEPMLRGSYSVFARGPGFWMETAERSSGQRQNQEWRTTHKKERLRGKRDHEVEHVASWP